MSAAKKRTREPKTLSFLTRVLIGLPLLSALWVWASALSFVPVPWPDDSAFYFVARDFFQWPPRWVMIPQAPFEPTYRIFNFNTMPLYPLLLGLGRWVGIDGSHALKFWPLLFWALSGVLLLRVLVQKGLARWAVLIVALLVAMDPILRWASVLVRPESLIGLCGVALVLGLTYGFPERVKSRGLWDPVAALLAIAAYSHFNSIHLLFPVVATNLWTNPKRLIKIGLKTALYLLPWIGAVLWQWPLFVKQMSTQWTRLAVPNYWLHSFSGAAQSLIQNMGSPESWSFEMTVVAWMMLPALLAAFFAWLYWGVLRPQTEVLSGKLTSTTPELIPALSWVVGAAWLWHTKPEVWFTYYLHLSFVVLVGVTLRWLLNEEGLKQRLAYGFGLYFFVVALLMTEVNVSQADRLGKSVSWNWDTFSDYVNCVDERLTQLEKSQANRAEPFQVWCPTYPDITIELSRRHPHWELTRTNDFHARNALALQHGQSVDAVVITEMIRPEERQISSPWSEHPEVRSVWMDWQGYYLHSLDEIPGWKPNRYLCQRGRWQAFIYMN